MTDTMAYGTLQMIDGRPGLRFERSLAYPIERVWQAVSVPAELERFFPGAADWTPTKGETIELGGATLEVTEVEAPHRLAWTFACQPQSFELVATEGGCRLIFTHVIDNLPAAQTATGWEIYLSRLEPHLAGEYLWLTVVSPEQPDGVELLLEPSAHPAMPPDREALVDDGILAAQFAVEDVQAEYERLRGLGVTFTQEPTQMGPVTTAVFDDTCGLPMASSVARSPGSRSGALTMTRTPAIQDQPSRPKSRQNRHRVSPARSSGPWHQGWSTETLAGLRGRQRRGSDYSCSSPESTHRTTMPSSEEAASSLRPVSRFSVAARPITESGEVMSTVVTHAVASVDGFIAHADDRVGPLFDWYHNGDVEITEGAVFRVSQASADYIEPMWASIGTMVIGRHLFDMTNGWEGSPPAGEHVIVVSHRPKPERWHPRATTEGPHPGAAATYHFIDDVAQAVTLASSLPTRATST